MIGIEVKSSINWKKEYNKGLNILLESKKIDRGIGVYMGDKNLSENKIKIFTIKNFIKELEAI